MSRRSILFLIPSVAWAQTDSADLLLKIRQAYANLNAIHVVARLSQHVVLPSKAIVAKQVDYELAARRPGHFRAWMRDGGNEALSLSDGSTIWKCLPQK